MFRWMLIAAVPLAAALDSFGDDIILTSGEVIEGKVDNKATAEANKGVADPNRMVYVVITDEKGTTRRIPKSDIKYIMAKKPSWEVRAENLDWYEKSVPKVKDDRASQENFGRQCRSRRLDEQARKHYARALEFRRQEMKDKGAPDADDHVKLADWCRKNALLDDERKEIQAALKLKREEAGKSEDKVRGLLDLASWCKRNDLDTEAMQTYEEVLKIDPQNRTADTAVKTLKNQSNVAFASVTQQYIQAKRAWRITVAVEDNANPPFFKEWEEKLKNLSDFIFEVTEGQFFVHEWVIEDQTSNGDIIIEKGKMDWEGMNSQRASGVLAYCKGSGSPTWEVHCPGKTWESVLCHEMFHGIFGLLDEYYQNPQCPCVMRSAPNPQKICNPQTHLGGGRQKEPCWDTIKKRYSDVTSPNPNWKYTNDAIKGKHGTIEVDGTLSVGSHKIVKAPSCKVIVVDK